VDYPVLITTRNIVNQPAHPITSEFGRSILRLMSQYLLPGRLETVTSLAFNLHPKDVPKIITESMKTLVGEYTNKSYEVLLLGDYSGYLGYAIELGFPISDHLGYSPKILFEAVEEIFRLTKQNQEYGEEYMTSPLSIRFVHPSTAHLSMMSSNLTAMIELDMVSNTWGGISLIRRIQQRLFSKFGEKMRVHWGLDFDGFNGDYVRKSYPSFPLWEEVYRQMNKEHTFDNSWTLRMGL